MSTMSLGTRARRCTDQGNAGQRGAKLERVPRERLDAGPASGAELLHVLMLRDSDRTDRIGEFYDDKARTSYPTRSANTTRRSAAENLGLQVVSTSVGLFV